MNNIIDKELVEKFKRLPKEVQEAILSVNLSHSLQEIVRNNKLLIDQSGKLEMEVVLVLLGLEPISDFIKNVSKQLSIDTEKAAKIAQDADNLIFKNIRASLQKLNQQEGKQSEIVGVANAPEVLSREQVLDGIENPVRTKPTPSITFNQTQVIPESSASNNLPMVEPENDIAISKVSLPQKTDGITITNSVSDKKEIENILEANLKGAVSLPKKQEIIEEKTKLPTKGGSDPYREPIE